MSRLLNRFQRPLSIALGASTLVGVAVLFMWDAFPESFPAESHNILAAFPLAMIAFAYLVSQAANRSPLCQWTKAIILAAAFLFWAANQLWPGLRQAILFNDLAIGLFVLDVWLVIASRPAASNDKAFAQACRGRKRR